MKQVFGDSYYFIALLNARDFQHARALGLTKNLPGKVVTTRRVLAEVGNALSGLGARGSFARFHAGLATQNEVAVLPDSDVLYERGVRLYASRSDKEWSLIDCISIEAMRSEGLTEVLTGDRHFSQAGFTLLMSDQK